MKIQELLKVDSWYDTKSHAKVSVVFDKYYEKDCVVAYLKEVLGTIFIIKGKQKYFAFVHQNPELCYGGYDYKLTMIEVKKALGLMKEKLTIADDDLFGKLNKYLIVEALSKRNVEG